MSLHDVTHVRNITLSDDRKAVRIIDQSLLPIELKVLDLVRAEEMYDAIFTLKIRGAPAIGIFAAYSLFVLAGQLVEADCPDFCTELKGYASYLNSARPTAVNLSWALQRMLAVVEEHPDVAPQQLLPMLMAEAVEIHQADIAMCTEIAENGLKLMHDGMGIITHCNAGPLATSRYGTALGPILLGKERGMQFRVFADETRPLLQGARLTTYELQNANVDVTLICDNMASMVMKNGWVEACFVGCDRVAANGDVANKIGTSGLAVLAKYYGIPFYVFGPSSTVDFSCPSGKQIKIEQRAGEEISSKFFTKPMAAEGVKCYNPAFDVTDHDLITAIITEEGIFYPPFCESLLALKK